MKLRPEAEKPKLTMYDQTKSGVYLKLIDYRKMYDSVANPIILNDCDIDADNANQELKELIRTSYDGDVISSIPSCACGATSEGSKRNTICEECGTPVVTVVDRPIESNVWMRTPKGVKAFIRPVVWTILKDTFKYKGLNIPEWICGIARDIKPKSRAVVMELEALGFKQSLNWFIDNFDWAIETLLAKRFCTSSGGAAARRRVAEFIHVSRDKIFTDILPMPNKIAFITESTSVGTYVDPIIGSALDAVQSIVTIDESDDGMRVSNREVRAAKTFSKLASFYYEYTCKKFTPKPGWYRKHIFGSTIDFSGRSVISSVTDNNADEDELHIPWGYALSIFKIHIANKMLKRGYTSREIEERIIYSSKRYDKELDEIMEELIAESPHKGFPCLFLRNPSLHRTSLQQLFITKVKKDPRIPTVSVHFLVIKGPNGDFDGDEMSLMLINDHDQFEYLQRLSPKYSVWDLQQEGKISGINNIPSPIYSSLSNYLYGTNPYAS